MQRVFYAGAELLMSDSAAEALLEFAALIAGAAKSQRLAIPVIGEQGEPSVIHAIIGPASQIVSVPVPSDRPDPDTSPFELDLGHRSGEYRSASAVVGDHAAPGWDELE
jgi:hypothetical protein